MTELNAAIGIAQFKKLKLFVRQRNLVAKEYDKLIKKYKLNIKILKPRNKNFRNSYFFYPILVDKRNTVAKLLRTKYLIDTRVAYPMPIYEQPLYKKKIVPFKKFNCPVAKEVSSKILNLPIYPYMKSKDIKKVVLSIKKIINDI